MTSKKRWHPRWTWICLLLLCCTLLTSACDAIPSDSGQQIQRGWDQQLADFWDQSLGRIVNPAMAWLTETYELFKQNAPQLAGQAWEWIKTQAGHVADWFKGKTPEAPPAISGGSLPSRPKPTSSKIVNRGFQV